MKMNKNVGVFAGVVRAGSHYIFRMALPQTEECRLLLYRTGTEEKIGEFLLSGDYKTGDVFTAEIEGIEESDFEYVYEVEGEQYIDPYAMMITGNREWGKRQPVTRGRYRSLESAGQLCTGQKRIPLEELFLYRLHVRGFTKDASFRQDGGGTFLGIQKKLPYLKKLGVNGIELMPAYEFNESAMAAGRGSVRELPEEQVNYWGYGSASYYCAPKNSYSWREDSAGEFLELVKACHREGIAVLMEFYFGPEMDQGRMTEVLRSWVLRYGVDGFHVNSNHCPVTLAAQDPLLSGCYLISDQLDGCPELPEPKRTAFSNDYFAHTARKFLLGLPSSREAFQELWNYQHPIFGRINYGAVNHGFTLWDVFSYNKKHNEANGEGNQDGPRENYSFNCGAEGKSRSRKVQELRLQMVKNLLCITFLANGVPMVQAGDEFGHSAEGNNNPYCQDNTVSWLNWNERRRHRELTEFVNRLVAVWKEHRIFHRADGFTERDPQYLGCPDYSVHGQEPWGRDTGSLMTGFLYYGKYSGENSVFLAFNMETETQAMHLPSLPEKGTWKILLQTSREEAVCLEDIWQIPARTIVIFEREEEGAEKDHLTGCLR